MDQGAFRPVYYWRGRCRRAGHKKNLPVPKPRISLHPSKADFVTLANAICGVVAIGILVRPASERTLVTAVLLVTAAAGCDLVDGIVARLYGSSVWGVSLDASADAISFGFAPAVAVLAWSHGHLYEFIVAGLLAASVIARLWRFVITPSANSFCGMPSPLGALIVLFILLVSPPGWGATVAILIVAALMISKISFPKPCGRWSIALLVLVCFLVIAGAASLYIWS